LLAGAAAGGVNAIVGSGGLITFPVLLAVGYPAVTANVTNSVGLVFGNFSAAHGYRRELRGQGRRALLLGTGSALGAVTGATLLLVLPSSVFEAIVPVLILLACALMLLRPSPRPVQGGSLGRHRIAALILVTYLVGVYGGYFGAAQGVILLAGLRLLIPEGMQRLNGLKNVLVGIANGVAALQFAIFADVAWGAAALIALGSVGGAQLGALYGRRIPDQALRWTVVGVGVVVAIVLFVT
jgi:uncharacterized membrane protein YfcA